MPSSLEFIQLAVQTQDVTANTLFQDPESSIPKYKGGSYAPVDSYTSFGMMLKGDTNLAQELGPRNTVSYSRYLQL